MEFTMGATRATVRIIGLLVIALGLVGLSPLKLLFFGSALFAWILIGQRELLPELKTRIARLRWFFLAIFILYLLGGTHPGSVSAWIEAGYRIGVLVILVAAVALCLHGMPPQELAAGVARGLRPLHYLGFPTDTFARRLAGTLDAVGHMDARVRAAARLDRLAALSSLANICADAERYDLGLTSNQGHVKAASRQDFLLLLLSLSTVSMLHIIK
jgi:hypothetical protein